MWTTTENARIKFDKFVKLWLYLTNIKCLYDLMAVIIIDLIYTVQKNTQKENEVKVVNTPRTSFRGNCGRTCDFYQSLLN